MKREQPGKGKEKSAVHGVVGRNGLKNMGLATVFKTCVCCVMIKIILYMGIGQASG
ncbi:MAG: hypothetical protein ACKO3B_00710 [Bacteroidota bacterium]